MTDPISVNHGVRRIGRRWQDIAIIGMSGRFPGAGDVDQFWSNLESGMDCITRLTDEQLLRAGIPEHVLNDTRYVKAAPLLNDYDRFDARFFRYSAHEAILTDPQQRVFLEGAWEALESAGYSTETERLRTAVFAGSALNTYLAFGSLIDELRHNFVPVLIANDKDFLATRVSYKLNLTGPSMTVQTACSTSLVAIHLACAALINGEADLALAGGVAVKVPHMAGYVCNAGSIVSPDGQCRPFDAAANGTVFGSGAGIVVLRRLDEAIVDHDNILAVIKGTAINNDGSDKPNFAAPRRASQTAAVLEALSIAGISADTVSFLEAHGTGTRLGDPIEITALSAAFREHTSRTEFCCLGSVKANVGHLDAAAGVTSVIKCVQALQHECIPPNSRFSTPNPEIDFPKSPFRINTRAEPWRQSDVARRAGINGLGVGGTNAFVILEEAPRRMAAPPNRPFYVATLSAKTERALTRQRHNLSVALKRGKWPLHDICFTLNVGRSAFPYRRAYLVAPSDTHEGVARKLDDDATSASHCEKSSRAVVFLFSDGVAGGPRAWSSLYESEREFREPVDECLACLAHQSEVAGLFHRVGSDGHKKTDDAASPSFASSSRFVVNFALARSWISLGVTPSAVVGDGLGRLIGACIAGVFPVAQALRIAAHWDGYDRRVAPRASASRKSISAGCAANFSADRDLLVDMLAATDLAAPSIPMMSSVTVEWIDGEKAENPLFWSSELCGTVQWTSALQQLQSELDPVWLRFGSSKDMPMSSHSTPKSVAANAARTASATLDLVDAESRQVGEKLATLWLKGASIDWERLHQRDHRGRVALPTYPFERHRFWIAEPRQDETAPRLRGERTIANHLSRNQLIRAGRTPSGSRERLDERLLQCIRNPPTAVHSAIAKIWSDILGIERIEFHDDFFQMGGDSIMMTDLVERINSTFAIDLPVVSLFESPTVEELANLVMRVFNDAVSDTGI